MTYREEGQTIGECISAGIQRHVYGKKAIQWLQKNSTQWRQSEWPGFYFEEFGRRCLIQEIGGQDGPRVGRTKFDYRRDFVWDLKCHSVADYRGRTIKWVVLNDLGAFLLAISRFGGLGIVVGSATMEYDNDGSFARWHDELKGGLSPYQIRKRKEGAWHRKRKTRMQLESIRVLFVENASDLKQGLEQGWLGNFQENFINSNDNARRKKLKLCLSEVPRDIILFEKQL